MYSRYFYWQFIAAPAWLAKLAGNIQIALLSFFSVPVMLSTLFSYWHKDKVSYKQGSISGIIQALAWNLISRGIGFVIRVIILIIWLLTVIVVFIVSVAAVLAFLLWPIMALVSIVWGMIILLARGI